MNNPTDPPAPETMTEQEKASALFGHLIMQHSNMAFILLGEAPHPQTGEITQDLEHAKFFIDMLEMLALKTKGNLDKAEEALMKQSLMALRMAYVEAISNPKAPAPAPAAEPAKPAEAAPAPAPETPAAEAESHKKFSKKY